MGVCRRRPAPKVTWPRKTNAMTDYTHDPRFISLRQQAERTLSRHEEDMEYLSLEAMRELLHELRVHQIELQLQNEELLRAHQEAEAERDRFAELYDSVPVGCLTIDQQGIIRDANRSGHFLLAGSAHDVVGCRLGDFATVEDQDAYFLFMRRLFRTGRQEGELRLQRFGEAPWMAQIEAQVVATGPEAGETCRLVLSDISARYQAERLRAQRDWLDVTLSSMGDALITTDTSGVVTFLNRAAIEFTGWPAPAALGRSLDRVWPLVDERTGQPVGRLVRHVYQLEETDGAALHMTLASRVEPKRIVAACAAAIISSVGPPQGAVVVFREMTAQRQLEARLRQTQKMEALGTLAGGIAHDFNNILTAILGYTHMSGRTLAADNPVQNYLHEVRAAALRAKELVQHILTFTRQHQMERQPVSIYPVVREALRMLRATLPATITMELFLDPDAGTVLAQADQVHQVLMNLCANAEYAMRQHGGLLRIGLDVIEVDETWIDTHASLEPGPYVRLTVEDTGPGIAAEVLPHVFEPYYTTKALGEGTGLGLAIVHGIVASHQGAITVDSTPGIGATFTVYFPRVAGLVVTEAPAPPNIPAVSPGEGERILLVEDEEPVALATEMQLTELGYRVLTHLSSTSALEAFQADPQQFDLVLTDQTMPSMTGEEFARVLHRIRPDVPIILVTGFSHVVDADKAHTLGIDAFLIKPWDVQEMADTIQRVLAQRRAPDPGC
jgi:PAS domain S-box-containing protein